MNTFNTFLINYMSRTLHQSNMMHAYTNYLRKRVQVEDYKSSLSNKDYLSEENKTTLLKDYKDFVRYQDWRGPTPIGGYESESVGFNSKKE